MILFKVRRVSVVWLFMCCCFVSWKLGLSCTLNAKLCNRGMGEGLIEIIVGFMMMSDRYQVPSRAHRFSCCYMNICMYRYMV